jgi:predicted RNase H-like HicB family nuclease
MPAMNFTFTAVYESLPPELGGGFMAYAAELPGAITEGETIEEARENLRDAVEQLLEANRMLADQKKNGTEVLREEMRVPLS